jgi:hypothetical protein
MQLKSIPIKQVLVIAALATAFCAGMWSVSKPAHAQHQWTQCASLTLPKSSNGSSLQGRQPPFAVMVPPGWAPIGGSQYKATPSLIVCR